jgi:adenine-specific DNA-methyltransferase
MVDYVEVDGYTRSKWTPYVKYYSEGRTKQISNLLQDIEGNKKASIVIKEIFGDKGVFEYPKPVEFIKILETIGSESDSIILDFFAGSGTTLHATMQLNAEDGGNRKCILVTNNENGICENVTYERNKRVINGYTKPNGDDVEGLKDNTLRYYRTSFVSRVRTLKNMRQLMSLATDMLCIKEDLYTEQNKFGELPTHPKVMRYFSKGGKSMLVIYYEAAIAEIVEQIEKLSPAEPIKVYVFSPSEDPWEEDFEFVSDKVELCALPAAIYNTYKRILPKKKDERVDIDVNAKEPEQPKGESTLFDLFEEGGEQ